MIRLKQVQTSLGDAYLTFEYDKESVVNTITINKQDIVDRLKTVKQNLGRPLTLQDAKLVIIRLINELREGKTPLSEDFDYSQFIGVDIET
jgi:hypothetical protein